MSTAALTGTLSRDANRNALAIAPTLQFKDATGTPINSPKTGITTTAQAFVVPTNAVAMVFRASAAVRFGLSATLDGAANQGYNIADADSPVVIPCAGLNGSSIYIRAETGTVSVHFHFEMLG